MEGDLSGQARAGQVRSRAKTSEAEHPGAEATLHTAVFDSLDAQIAVIDELGHIVDVNRSWTEFGAANGLSSDFDTWIGVSYLDALTAAQGRGDSVAGEAALGINEVLDGRRTNFDFQYPCHSPSGQRWFVMRVDPLEGHPARLVISHQDVTRRKLAEDWAHYLALHDDLTGLANRRHFNSTLHREFARCRREGAPISLIAIDIDHFKNVNDERGHLFGDDFLAQVGKVISLVARENHALAARLGGDEFALLLPGMVFAEAEHLAKSMLQSINDLELADGKSASVSASVGVASVIPDELMSGDMLLQQADEALYRAKHAGRNRVMGQPGAGTGHA